MVCYIRKYVIILGDISVDVPPTKILGDVSPASPAGLTPVVYHATSRHVTSMSAVVAVILTYPPLPDPSSYFPAFCLLFCLFISLPFPVFFSSRFSVFFPNFSPLSPFLCPLLASLFPSLSRYDTIRDAILTCARQPT